MVLFVACNQLEIVNHPKSDVSYAADGIGGAYGLLAGLSGVAGWMCHVVSTAWSMAVDKWEPEIPEWTNCDNVTDHVPLEDDNIFLVLRINIEGETIIK